VRHYRHRIAFQRLRAQAALDGCSDEPRTQRFGEIQEVAGVGAVVSDYAVGVRLAYHCVAELRLRVVDGVATDHGDACLAHLRGAT